MKLATIVPLLQALAVPIATASAISLPPKEAHEPSEMVTTSSSTPDGLAPRQGAPCTLYVHYDQTWEENALIRYSVKATANGVAYKAGWADDTRMLKEWCKALGDKFRDMWASYGLSNPQCWGYDDHTFISHISTVLGPVGHHNYVEFHQQAVNLWRDRSKLECDVESAF